MKPLLTREAARAFDQKVIAAGVSGAILMENAGRGATDVLLARMPEHLARPVIVGGTGQNGGDAWVVARRLLTLGYRPQCFLAGDEAAIGGDARVMLDALRAVGGDVRPIGEIDFARATVVVDGLFGTGLDRDIAGWRAELIERMHGAPVFALDLPSGIDANTGAILGVAVRAAVTATFAAAKRGLWQAPGRDHAGETVCVDIGVPPPSSDDALLELRDAADVLTPRALAAHKGTGGHVLVIAGSPGKSGAALLSGLGAMRGGAGLVTLAARGEARAALDARVVELMTMELPVNDAVPEALAAARGKAAAVLGPGFGLDEHGRRTSVALALSLEIPTVIDADALTALAEAGLEALREASGPRVLTPHPGEAARLLGCDVREVERDRYAAARMLAERSGHVVVLKGAGTVIADASRTRVCPLGTPALGVAGTGDVLSGAVAAALATGVSALDAATAMVLLHARAGELAARSDRGLFAREVADHLPAALEDARAMTR